MMPGMDLSDRLAEIEQRYERLQAEMAEPDVARDQDRLRRLGKDLAELGEIVAPYREYRTALQQAEEARSLAKEESDPEMAGFLREEAGSADARATELRSRLEALLVPKDPNDGKDVVVEIRAGAGGTRPPCGRARSSRCTGTRRSASGGGRTCSRPHRRTSVASGRS